MYIFSMDYHIFYFLNRQKDRQRNRRRCLYENWKPTTYIRYRNCLEKYILPHCGLLHVREIDQKVYNALITLLEKKLSVSSMHTVNTVISGILKHTLKRLPVTCKKELEYCKQLLSIVKDNEDICSYPKVQEKLNLLEESVNDDLEHLETSKDNDARTGHKTADTSFFGYKTHIAMTEERIITAATITSGEKTDGKELPTLVRKSRAAGMKVETVIGDKAYSSKENIDAAKDNHYELISRLNSIVTQGNRIKPDEFEFNKDAGMYQCKAGHLAIHKYLDKRKKAGKNPRMTYFFDIEKCKRCLYKAGCYKEGAKRKTYTETLICDSHSEQDQFQEIEHFKEMAKERYKIEARNSELKHRHGYDVASSSGLIGIEMQGAMAIFAVNLKRIIKLISEK